MDADLRQWSTRLTLSTTNCNRAEANKAAGRSLKLIFILLTTAILLRLTESPLVCKDHDATASIAQSRLHD